MVGESRISARVAGEGPAVGRFSPEPPAFVIASTATSFHAVGGVRVVLESGGGVTACSAPAEFASPPTRRWLRARLLLLRGEHQAA